MRTRSDIPGEKSSRARQKRRRSSASIDETTIATQRTTAEQSATAESPLNSSLPQVEAKHSRAKKRAKKLAVDATQQQVPELDDVNHQDDAEGSATDNHSEGEGENEHITISEHRSSKRVRFSESRTQPVVEIPVVPEAAPAAESTPTGLTPKVRRTSLTAAELSRPTRSRNAGRRSLPASFSPSPNDTVQQLQFSPLRAVLDDRMRRRLRRSHLSEEVNDIEEHKREDARTRHELDKLRHEVDEKDKRVKQLMVELELQRQLGIEVGVEKDEEDERVREMEEELARLRREISESKEHDGFQDTSDHPNDEVDMDDDMVDLNDDALMLVNPADIDSTPEEMTPQPRTIISTPLKQLSFQFVTPTEASTQVSLPDPTHEAERHEFEKAIAILTREASDAKAALKILSIELQSLGFTAPDANAEAVLSSIRSVFYQARTELEELLPGATPGNVDNAALLNLLIEHIRTLIDNVRDQAEALGRHESMEGLLRNQLNGVLDKLADVDSRKQMLEAQWRDLDMEGERKEKEIIELSSQVDELRSQSQEHAMVINQGEDKIHSLEEEVVNYTKTIERLQNALQGYRDEVTGLETLITKMEEQHRVSLDELRAVHVDTVSNLEERIKVESSHRETAEAEIDEKTTRITALELMLEQTSTSLEELNARLAESEALAQAERESRENAESTLVEQSTIIASLESKVSTAESSLESLSAELESLRNLATLERDQRQAAESLLDERESQITDLENGLHNAGITANMLREKLFEVQQARERELAKLNNEAAERENQFQEDIAAEIERREEAERVATSTRMEMDEREREARNKEETLQQEVAYRDERIEEYERELADTERALEEANSQAAAAQQKHDHVSAQLRAEITELDLSLGARNAELAELQNTLEQRSGELEAAKETINRLEDVRASLERRIEAEAEELLAADERHAEIESGLRSQIAQRDIAITQLQADVHNRVNGFEHLVQEKDVQIDTFKTMVAARDSQVASLDNQAQMLRAALRERVAMEKTVMGQVAEAMRDVADRVGVRTQEFVAEGTELVRALDAEAETTAVIPVNGNGDMVSKAHSEHKYLRSEIHIGPNGVADAKADETVTTTAAVEKRAGRKTAVRKRRSRRREFDSGIGVAAEEQEVEEEAEADELVWV